MIIVAFISVAKSFPYHPYIRVLDSFKVLDTFNAYCFTKICKDIDDSHRDKDQYQW